MTKLGYCLLNTLSLALTLVVNYLASAGNLTGQSMGEVSAEYSTLITPAGYAFSIWGFIYLWLIAYVIYQWYARKSEHSEIIRQAGGWFALTNLFNAAWVVAFTNGYIGFSVPLMFALLFSLIMLVKRHRLEVWDAPLRIIAFVWWPICWYLGWIILASVTNVAAYLVSIGWRGGPLGEESWTVLMLAAATIINVALTFTRNMREVSLVGIWGLVAIAIKNWEVTPFVVWASLICSGILFAAASYHGFKNRDTAPVEKWKRGEV